MLLITETLKPVYLDEVEAGRGVIAPINETNSIIISN